MLKALSEECLSYVGTLLFCKVHSGYGWQGTQPDAVEEEYGVFPQPPDFHLRPLYFFKHHDIRRGGVAKIEEAGHPYDAYWTLFCTRPMGVYNITDILTIYSLGIGPNEPVMLDPATDPETAAFRPLWEFSGDPQMKGFGVVAVVPEQIKQWETGLMDKR